MDGKRLTVIIPCYRSETYIEKTAGEILAVFLKMPSYRCRLVLVDDASPDGTYSAVSALAEIHPEITCIGLRENAGQARAKMAGLPLAEGGFAVFMDDDGQHDPSYIPALLRKAESGYDLVYAQFPELRETGFRKLMSRIMNLLLIIFVRKPRDLRVTSFFALSPRAVSALMDYRSPHPFIGGWLMSHGYRAAGIPAAQRARSEGTSRYSLRKLVVRAAEMCFLWRITEKDPR